MQNLTKIVSKDLWKVIIINREWIRNFCGNIIKESLLKCLPGR